MKVMVMGLFPLDMNRWLLMLIWKKKMKWSNSQVKLRNTMHNCLEEIEAHYFDERDDLVQQAVQAAPDDVQETYLLILHIIHCAFFHKYSKRFLSSI